MLNTLPDAIFLLGDYDNKLFKLELSNEEKLKLSQESY